MKSVYIFLFACLPLVAFTCADWTTFSIDDQFAVQMPSQPKETDLGKASTKIPQTIKVFSAQDAAGTYMLMRLAATDPQANMQSESSRTAFYDGLINGLLRGQNGVLLSRTTFSTAGGEGVDVKYRGLDKGTGKMGIKYSRTLVLGAVAYSLSFYSQDRQDTTGISGSESRKKFFESIVAKPASVPKK
ncbi:hypothetical protein [uncultured Hymenobacter sp.]|uniref:hypothetical protein n=1 Tax=uncultured Hymenobacter sp. TaxID=170016 RepID=UPI0035CB8461